jgi:hypothetical protein
MVFCALAGKLDIGCTENEEKHILWLWNVTGVSKNRMGWRMVLWKTTKFSKNSKNTLFF